MSTDRIAAIRAALDDGIICYCRDYDDYNDAEARRDIGWLLAEIHRLKLLIEDGELRLAEAAKLKSSEQ